MDPNFPHQQSGQAPALDTNAFNDAAARAAQQSLPAQQYNQPGVGPSPSYNPGADAGFNFPQQSNPGNQQPQYQQPQYAPQYPQPTDPTPQPQGFQGDPTAGNPWGQGSAQWQQPTVPQPQPQASPTQYQQQAPYQQPAQPQPTQAQQQYPAWDANTAARLQQYGVDPSLPPSEQINQLTQRIDEMRPYAQFGQQMASQPVANQQPQQTQQDDADEFDPDAYFNQAWGAPQWNQQYDIAMQQGMVERDPASGLFRPAQGYEMMVSPQLLHGLNEAMQYQTQNVQKLFRENPYRQIYQVMREPMRREMEREMRNILNQEMGRMQNNDFLSKFQEKNSTWLFSTDATGRKSYSPAGEQFIREAEALIDAGIDVRKAVEYAERITAPVRQQYESQRQQQQQTPSYQPQQQFTQQPQQQVLPFMQQPQQPQYQQQPMAQPMAQQAGFPNSPTLQRPMSPEMASAAQQQSFLQNALQMSSYTPSAVGAPGAAQPPGPPRMLSPEGLESMFTNAAHQLGAA